MPYKAGVTYSDNVVVSIWESGTTAIILMKHEDLSVYDLPEFSEQADSDLMFQFSVLYISQFGVSMPIPGNVSCQVIEKICVKEYLKVGYFGIPMHIQSMIAI